MFVSVFAICAPVTEVSRDLEKRTAVLQAEYVGMALQDSWERAIPEAIKLVRERFASLSEVVGQVTVKEVVEDGMLKSLYFGYTHYAPMGVDEIPLVIIQTSNFEDYLEKFFEVDTNSIKEQDN